MSFNCLPPFLSPYLLLHNNKQAKKRSHNAGNKSESRRRRRRSRRIPEITIATSTSDVASNVQAKTNANKFLTRHFIVELVTLLNAPIARNLIAKVIDLKCSQEVLKFGLPLRLPPPLFPNLFCDLIKCSAPVIDLSHLGAISDRLGSDLGIGIMTAYRIWFLMKPFPCLLHSISFAVPLHPAPAPSPAIDLFRCSPVDHLASSIAKGTLSRMGSGWNISATHTQSS